MPAPEKPKKLVLGVIDALKPEMLDRAITEGRAPVLAALSERGLHVRDCAAAFPSLTPVCAASIATGLSVEEHGIPSTNWYHRGEERYVEYGSSFSASQAHGVRRSLIDTVYNMNLAHLTQSHRTVFEHLDDAGLRTAGTTYLIYRGRTRHEPASAGIYPWIARAAQFTYGTWGPGELFYADLFASRDTGCTSTLGLPGQRDQHTACVGAHLIEHDLFDFMLFSLPDNDTYSHRRGPYAQVTSIEAADRALERLMHVAGGIDAFLEDHAIIVMSDHSQTAVEDMVSLSGVFGDLRVLTPGDGDPEGADLAACPIGRSAGVYVLDPERREELSPRVARALAERRRRRPVRSARGRRGRGHRRHRRAALRGGRRVWWTRAASAGAWRATSASSRSSARTVAFAAAPTRTRCDACGGDCARGTPETSCARRLPATSSSTGAARTTSAAAATGRCTATIRSA